MARININTDHLHKVKKAKKQALDNNAELAILTQLDNHQAKTTYPPNTRVVRKQVCKELYRDNFALNQVAEYFGYNPDTLLAALRNNRTISFHMDMEKQIQLALGYPHDLTIYDYER